MAKKISLQLEINGVKQSVSSIDDLEKSISELKNQLKGVDIGSKEFEKLSGEIRKAQNFAEDLNENLKPQELEKRVGAYAKVGSAIVSSFAAAQATISLFGEESEDVARAAAQAQAVLTIALTAREAAEGLVAIKTVAANIATVASAAAANAANTATRALYATLAANPYTAILAVIGLVAGALIAFTGETEKAVDVTTELKKATSEEANQLRNTLFILTQMNGQRALQSQELEKLKKDYPGFNAFIDKENKLNANGIKFLELKVKQYELEAKAKLITQRIAENGIKILEIENTAVLDNVSYWEKAINSLKNLGTVDAGLTEEFRIGLENRRKKIEEITNENKSWSESLTEVYRETDLVLQKLKPLEETLTNQVTVEENLSQAKENTKKTQEELNQAYEKGKKDIISFKEQLELLDKSLKKYDETIKNLDKLTISAKIIEDLENVKKSRTEAAKVLNNEIQQVQDGLKTITKIPQDEFLKVFANFRTALETAFTKPQESLKKYDVILKLTLDNAKNLSIEQKELLVNLAQGYKDFDTLIKTSPGFTTFIEKLGQFDIAWNKNINDVKGAEGTWTNLLNILGDLSAASGDFRLELDDQTKSINRLNFDPIKARKNADRFYSELRQGLFEPVTRDLLEQRKSFLEKGLGDTGLAADVRKNMEGQLETVKKAIKDFKPGMKIDASIIAEKDIEQAVDNTIGNFEKLLRAVATGEQKVLEVALRVQELQKDLSKSPEELSRAIGGVVLQNIDAISNVILGARTEEQKLEKKFAEEYKNSEKIKSDFKKMLIQQGVDVEKASYEDLLKAYVEYKKKEVDATKQTEKDKKDAIAETLSEVGQYIQVFSSTINQVASLSSQSIQNQLDFLEKSTEATLKQVVGDTESAEKKREEIRADYAQKKQELEKKQAISSLKFSLVQAIANAAQAITSIFAQLGGTPLAFIQSAIVAGLTTAEIAIINEQINTAQMFRRGGLTKAQGGMLLSGPTHEQGGIPLAQMGIIAEGQEAIINRNSLINYRDLLSTVNQAGGGRPLVVNSFDDTRIVEAIAEQRQKPLRAYVLQSEITNEQALSKRLDDLSKI